MTVGIDHPVVADYLRRLDAAAAGLPPDRREELVAEIRAHVVEALAATGADDEASVRGVLDRLGEPGDIVAAEPMSNAWAAAAGPPRSLEDPGVGVPEEPPSPWGALEVVAVLGLTVGTVVVPVVGPLVGLACAWMSDRWTRREKVVASVWTAVAPLVAVLGLGALLVVRASVGVS